MFATGEAVHADKPLGGGAIDDWCLVTPAVHVTVGEQTGSQQTVCLFQLCQDGWCGFPDIHASEEGEIFGKTTVALNRVENVIVAHAIAHAGVEVVHAIGWRAVHNAGASIGGDVVSEQHWRQPIVERVPEVDAIERDTLRSTQHLAFELVAIERALTQFSGQNEQAARGFDQLIDMLRVYVERLVGGNGPGRGRPDDGEHPFIGQGVEAESVGEFGAISVSKREANVYHWRLFVLILDFGFGQRRTTVEAPVYRLQAFEKIALSIHVTERPDLVGFVREVHGAIGIVPVAKYAKANEVFFLAFDLFVSIFTAQAARFVCRQVFAVLFFDHVFDRQAVTVPAGHIGRIKARQVFGADDDVFKDLVDRVADVNVAVGVGGTIVKHKARTAS